MIATHFGMARPPVSVDREWGYVPSRQADAAIGQVIASYLTLADRDRPGNPTLLSGRVSVLRPGQLNQPDAVKSVKPDSVQQIIREGRDYTLQGAISNLQKASRNKPAEDLSVLFDLQVDAPAYVAESKLGQKPSVSKFLAYYPDGGFALLFGPDPYLSKDLSDWAGEDLYYQGWSKLQYIPSMGTVTFGPVTETSEQNPAFFESRDERLLGQARTLGLHLFRAASQVVNP